MSSMAARRYRRLVQDVLPEARFVHLVRGGRDVALSVRGLWRGPNSAGEAAAWWAGKVARARRQEFGLRHDLEVRYEDLVAEPAATLRRVCEFLDLGWSDAMLRYHERASARLVEFRLPRTSAGGGGRLFMAEEMRAIHVRAVQLPGSDRVGRWRREMASEDKAAFERVAGRALEALGYSVSTESDAEPPDGSAAA
jgi:hypothetical protein